MTTTSPTITVSGTPFVLHLLTRTRLSHVPTVLPHLPAMHRRATITLPPHLHGSGQPRSIDLTDRRQSAWMYGAVLIEGGPTDVLSFVDATLLLEVFDDLALPGALRSAWQPVVDAARRTTAAVLCGSGSGGIRPTRR